MTLSVTEWAPALAGLLYLAGAVGYAAQGQRGLALTYTAYAIANVGLIWAAMEGRR